jgi:hypothetical protein
MVTIIDDDIETILNRFGNIHFFEFGLLAVSCESQEFPF